MTSHELAKKLLELPDFRVFIPPIIKSEPICFQELIEIRLYDTEFQKKHCDPIFHDEIKENYIHLAPEDTFKLFGH